MSGQRITNVDSLNTSLNRTKIIHHNCFHSSPYPIPVLSALLAATVVEWLRAMHKRDSIKPLLVLAERVEFPERSRRATLPCCLDNQTKFLRILEIFPKNY